MQAEQVQLETRAQDLTNELDTLVADLHEVIASGDPQDNLRMVRSDLKTHMKTILDILEMLDGRDE
jgi:hypothetical protein